MPTFTLPFSSPNATLARAGGKGANLAELSQAGFGEWVPPGFLVGVHQAITRLKTGQRVRVDGNADRVSILQL